MQSLALTQLQLIILMVLTVRLVTRQFTKVRTFKKFHSKLGKTYETSKLRTVVASLAITAVLCALSKSQDHQDSLVSGHPVILDSRELEVFEVLLGPRGLMVCRAHQDFLDLSVLLVRLFVTYTFTFYSSYHVYPLACWPAFCHAVINEY